MILKNWEKDLKNLNFKNTLVVVTGPTAIGKTAIGIELAKYYDTEIVSADSRQFYKELKIGTCPPSAEELKMVPHHFIGNLSINDSYNVSTYEQEVLKKLDILFSRNNIVFMVGGSGLYIDAVCKGIDNLPDPDVELRQILKTQFETQGISHLRAQLKLLDPLFYNIVDLNNPNRVLRALEVCLQTGKPYSSLRKGDLKKRDFKIVQISLNTDREKLYTTINERVDLMIKNGLIEEVESLQPYQHLNPLNTVGYRELFDYFNKKVSLDGAIEKIKTNTRRYAKRQLTWIRKSLNVDWFTPVDVLKMKEFIENSANNLA